MKKIKHFIKTKKVLSIIILLILIGGAYWIYKKSTSTTGETTYITTKVKRENLLTTITGTGQVSASSQVEIKSKTSGELTYLNTQANGTMIKKGTLIAQIDTRDAAITLESARIAYEKATKPANASDVLTAENAFNDAVLSNRKSYEDGFNTLVKVFLDLPEVVTGLNDTIYARDAYLQTEKARSVGQTALTYREKAATSYDKAKVNYNFLLDEFKNISRASSTSTIETFTEKTYLLVKDVSEALKNTQNAVEYIKTQKEQTENETPIASIATWTTTINSNLSSLLSSKTTMVSTAQDIVKKTSDLVDLKNGLDSLDLRTQQLSLLQKQNDYENYFIRAPFDGLLAKLSVRATDSVSSGTAIGTLVSSQKLTSITLNEVDVSKVHVGQKAKLTFDAIDGLTMDGTVTAVDLIGTVSQGVVNYNVEITLDTQDERIKSGMSVSASIIVESKENVLTVPNSAIKTLGKQTYIEAGNPPRKINVEIGISNDISTEIISGVEEGNEIITRTILGTATKTTTAPSLFGSGGRVGGTTGASRATPNTR